MPICLLMLQFIDECDIYNEQMMVVGGRLVSLVMGITSMSSHRLRYVIIASLN